MNKTNRYYTCIRSFFLALRLPILVVALAIAMDPPVAHSVKLYKWVDEDGNVTYRDTPPPRDAGGKVEEKQIDPDAGVTEFVLPKPSSPASDKGPAPAGQAQGTPPASGGRAIIGAEGRFRTERRRGVVPTLPPRPAPAVPARPPRPAPGRPPPRVPRLGR